MEKRGEEMVKAIKQVRGRGQQEWGRYDMGRSVGGDELEHISRRMP